jgi:hypothetical protein
MMVFPIFIFPSEAFYYYTIRLPFQLGRGRVEGSLVSRITRSAIYFKILLLSLTPLLFFVVTAYRRIKDHCPELTRALLFVCISFLFGVLTKNSFYNVTTPILIFTCLLFHYLLLEEEYTRPLVRFYRRFHFLLWVMLIGIISIINFRRTMDIQFRVKDLAQFSSRLNLFIKTPLDRYSVKDVEKLQTLIKRNQVLYTGDMQFLFSLSGKRNPLPLTHINDQTTYNSRDAVHYILLKKQVLNNIIGNHCTMLIEDESMYNPDQDLVSYLTPIKGSLVDSFAGMKVYTIDTAKLAQLASSLNMRRER